jgi:HEAT repeat protein
MKTIEKKIYKGIPKEFLELIEKYEDNNGLIREKARHSLVNMGTRVVPYLHKLADIDDDTFRWEICKTISEIADENSIDILIKVLKDPNGDIRWIAAEGLIHIGRKSIPSLLREIMHSNDSLFLREGAHHVISKLVYNKDKDRFLSLLDSLESKSETSELAPLEASRLLSGIKKQ